MAKTDFIIIIVLRDNNRAVYVYLATGSPMLYILRTLHNVLDRYKQALKTWGFPSQFIKSTKVLMATPQGRRLGYHTPKQVSNQEPPDSRPCV